MSRFVAFQSRDFRLLWSGHTFSTIGSEMQLIAINWHVFALLRGETYVLNLFGKSFDLGAEALGLGALGFARVLPIFIFAMVGGMLADRFDRRRVLITTQMAAALFAGILALLTLTNNITIPLLYLLTAIGSALTVLTNPSQHALIPNLVPAKYMANAVSLNTLRWYGASIVGPGLAGLLISWFNPGIVYVINALSFMVMLLLLLPMQYRRQTTAGDKIFTFSGFQDGLKFTFGTPIITSTMLLDFVATFFSSARTMLPLIADQVLHVGVQGYGWLATAQPVGGVIAGIFLATRIQLKKQGIILLVSVAIYGLATALFGLSTWFTLSYFLFALTGVGDMVSTVIRGTLRQLKTPDILRGRMTGINMVFSMGGPQLGELEAGLVAAAMGAPFAIVTGGIGTILCTALIAWYYPQLRRYQG